MSGAAPPPPLGVAPRPGRPFVWLNCAVSLDGRLAFAGGRQARLSSPEDLARVQRLRAGLDAILVGVGTVIADDPSLRVHWELLGPEAGPGTGSARSGPLRVVLDSRGRTPPRARVLDGRQPTVLLTSKACRRAFPPSVETAVVGEERVELPSALKWLHGRGVRSLMVEGGAEVLTSFVRERLVDRWTIYTAPFTIGGRTAPTLLAGPECPDEAGSAQFVRRSLEPLGPGVLTTWEPAAP